MRQLLIEASNRQLFHIYHPIYDSLNDSLRVIIMNHNRNVKQ
jgi:hypothetical protein